MSNIGRVYIAGVLVLGALALVDAGTGWQCENPTRFLVYLAISLMTSSWKVHLPGVHGTMSGNFLYVLLGIVELSRGETIVIASSSVLLQRLWRPATRIRPLQLAFNVASIAIAAILAHRMFNWAWLEQHGMEFPVRLAAAATLYFLANTGSVALVISATEKKNTFATWRDTYFWSFPYYLVGAGFVGGLSYFNGRFGWQATILILPVIFFIYRSYSLYLERLETEKRQAESQRRHAEEMAALHLRTIEALAMAIEAKDEVTHSHLTRVQVYSMAIARELSLSELETQALQAASLLHDIGKLAVPEHIISKPGKLTPEEFEKMKIHPVVGAEILERVQFPYPVVPVVRHHHEKWDGSGYPDGLRGEQIPIGSRILAAVDCLDALASDRQYRRALPIDEAMGVVSRESGKAFDPRIVSILERRFRELEADARNAEVPIKSLTRDLRVERGAAPDAGFEEAGKSGYIGEPVDFLNTIAAARQEAQILFEITQDLVNSMQLQEALSLLSVRVKKLIPYDSFAVYVVRDGVLYCEHAVGDDFRLCSGLQVPLGQGLIGWVAENRKPSLNGNPSVDLPFQDEGHTHTNMRSALAVPLEGTNGVAGVIVLYCAERAAFSPDHLRVLQVISGRLGISIENKLQIQKAEVSAVTDYLTGLPNARSLFLRLAAEVKAAYQTGSPMSMFVCDLDGFKSVNDRFGHMEGNRLLQAVAGALRNACRDSDYIARMGGDEFLVVLPGLNRHEVTPIAERVRQAIEAAGCAVTGQQMLSASIGIASYPEHGLEPETLLAEADRLMYAEKNLRKCLRAPSLVSLADAMNEGAGRRHPLSVQVQ